MTTKKWLILFGAAAVLCLAGAGVLAVCLGFGFHANPLRVFKVDQTPSAHAGYLRDTLTSGKDIYVNDYEDAALRLANLDPPQVIGSLGWPGNMGARAIAGEPLTAYIAGDQGSEMPAYAVYRNASHPAFDWRTAAFREMTFSGEIRKGSTARTTDPAMISEVVRVLRDGTPVSLPSFPMSGSPNVSSLDITCDELPGIIFCPPVYTDATGALYVAESLMLDTTVTPPQFHARWIPASPTLTRWLLSR
jgi:hypothetical protein